MQISKINRIKGCLVGGAIGDAYGYPIEFEYWPASAVKATVPPMDLTLNGYCNKPAFSDDTQMTLFTLEGLILDRQNGRGGVIPEVRNAYVRWLGTQELGGQVGKVYPGIYADPRLHFRRAPGATCVSAMTHSIQTGKLEAINDSKGCGTVMRSAPFGFMSSHHADAWTDASMCSKITHGHPLATLSAGYFASMIHSILNGGQIAGSMLVADTLLVGEADGFELRQLLNKIRGERPDGWKPTILDIEDLGGGWVAEEALAIALLCVLHADLSTEDGIIDCLWRAVNHPGDSDSTGAIAGNLIGAYVGFDRLPKKMVEQIEMLDIMEKLVQDVLDVA